MIRIGIIIYGFVLICNLNPLELFPAHKQSKHQAGNKKCWKESGFLLALIASVM
jgi:hypothetical protein